MAYLKSPLIIHPPVDISVSLQDDNKIIGQMLWDRLGLSEDDFVLTRDILPIIIESNDAKIFQLPWELLYHPTYGFLAQHPNFTLSRKVKNAPKLPLNLQKRPLKILFFSTLPDNLSEEERLAVEREHEIILETLLPYRKKGLVDIQLQNDGRFETFQQLISLQKPDLVFLSGHSSYRNGKGFFLFEDKLGLGIEIDEEHLTSTFVGSSVECVVLSSCQSAQLDQNMLYSGLMMKLVSSGIRHVVGMRESIYDEAGICFAEQFVTQIANKESVVYAVQKAREAIASLPNNVKEHWHLPVIVSQDVSSPLIDWDFIPTPLQREKLNKKLNQIPYPSQYIGRRKEFRMFYNYFYNNKLKKLLVCGEGGIGKTAMVAKFGVILREKGYKVFDHSLKHGEDFDLFLLDIELSLSESAAKKFRLIKERCQDDFCLVHRIANLLLEEYGKIVFIFDNLESVQSPDNKNIIDNRLKIWIDTLDSFEDIIVLTTSRWRLPECKHIIALNRPLKTDFLYFISTKNINFERRDQLEKIYQVLGGNYRGTELFLSAIEKMDTPTEENFLNQLKSSTREIQIDMTIEKIISYLNIYEKELLYRICVYTLPVPKEGIRKITLDLPKEFLDQLVSFSLVEESFHPTYEVKEYQISALVFSWLQEREEKNIENDIKKAAGEYLFWLFLEERKTLYFAMIAYEAMQNAGIAEKMEKWLFSDDNEDRKLRGIILNELGAFYYKLTNFKEALKYWEKSFYLAQLIDYRELESTILNNIAQIYDIQGNLKDSLEYLRKSLELYILINDQEGECTVLNNIGSIYKAKGNLVQAIIYLEKALEIANIRKDKNAEGIILNNLSQIYKIKGDLPRTLDYLKKSLIKRKEVGDRVGEATTLNNISQVYHIKGDLSKAFEYLNSALEIQILLENKLGEGTTYNNMASIYYAHGDFMKALQNWEKSLTIQNAIGNKSSEGIILNNISQVYKKRGDFTKALEYLEKAINIQIEIEENIGLCASLFNIGQIYYAKNEQMKAIDIWIKNYEIATAIGNKQSLDALEELANSLGLPNGLKSWETLAKNLRN